MHYVKNINKMLNKNSKELWHKTNLIETETLFLDDTWIPPSGLAHYINNHFINIGGRPSLPQNQFIDESFHINRPTSASSPYN